MSNIERAIPNLPAPGRVGQATAIEQSRAVAEVQAAIVVAQQCPRDIQAALKAMRESCAQKGLADRSFFRFPRGRETVTGPSVYLARELARCWGNIQYGIAELRRDDVHGQSEMQAYAWDVQTNTRVSSVFVVPHKRDTSSGAKDLKDMRDIYENNANAGARRVREAIFAVLPPWFVEEAKELCNKTIEKGGGQTLAQRVSEAITAFEGGGITTDQLERKVGRPTAQWTAHDVAQLEVIYASLRRGEVTKEEEFPSPPRVTVADITGASPAAPQPAPAEPAKAVEPAPAGDKQLRDMNILMSDCGITPHTGKGSTAANDEARFAWLSDFLGTPVTGSTKTLTAEQADRVIAQLTQMKVARASQRDYAERQVADLFDKFDQPVPAARRLADLSRLLGRQISAPADISDVELNDITKLLIDCAGQSSAWNAALEAMDAQRQDVSS